jgi:2-methylisocitrate lyase-like PEP mutase family enzyme
MTFDLQKEKARALLALNRRAQPLVLPCAWNAGSARLLTGLGFEAVGISGAGIAFGLGRQDGKALVSRDKIIGNARSVVAATHLPVAADLENGLGDSPEAVGVTVRMAIEAGLAGGSIEDATGLPDAPIYPIATAVERIVAAAKAAHASGGKFVLTARAENFIYGRADLDDTLRRVEAYEAAGADMLYVGGLPDLDAVRRVCGAVSVPVAILIGRGGKFNVAELAAAGARQVNLGAALPRVAYGGMLRAAQEVKERGTFSFMDAEFSFDRINEQMADEA